MEVYIGTSGWSYNHWKKVFYPEELSKYKWFEFYSSVFKTVEINATFYRDFKESTFKNWKRKSPSGFKFSLKAPKILTHIKRLKDIESDFKKFIEKAKILEDKLGVILFQFPPGLKFDNSLIADFLEIISKENLKFAIEVRNKSFHTEDFFDILKNYNIALCISDTAGRFPSLIFEVTADFTYVRLHGSKKLYASKYTLEELIQWANRILKWNRTTYVYFDNDYYGYAPQNAIELKKILTNNGITVH